MESLSIDDFLELDDLDVVEIDGFKVSISGEESGIDIERNGKKHIHFFISREQISSKRDYERAMLEALQDFIRTAETGNGSKEDYIKKFGWRMSKREITEAWQEYRTAAKALKDMTTA